MRLVKFLAHAGVASRRKSEDLIRRGQIKVNGQPVRDPARSVTSQDEIEYQGKSIGQESRVYYLFHKPAGVTSTLSDRHAERTLTYFLKNIPERVFPVGRLDKSSTGLMILTNDGELMQRLTHPRFEVIKTYEICVWGMFQSVSIHSLLKGIVSEGDRLVAKSVKVAKQMKDKTILHIQLGEGKKRELRRMMESQGHSTISLKRISFGPLELKNLKSGELKKLSKSEIASLKRV